MLGEVLMTREPRQLVISVISRRWGGENESPGHREVERRRSDWQEVLELLRDDPEGIVITSDNFELPQPRRRRSIEQSRAEEKTLTETPESQ